MPCITYQLTLPRTAHHHWDSREEMSVENDLLLKGLCIAILSCLREFFLRNYYEGHQDITKDKIATCTLLYWPAMDEDINDYIQMVS